LNDDEQKQFLLSLLENNADHEDSATTHGDYSTESFRLIAGSLFESFQYQLHFLFLLQILNKRIQQLLILNKRFKMQMSMKIPMI